MHETERPCIESFQAQSSTLPTGLAVRL